jgi:succinyl-diaminopimelate desuccinylase
MNTAQTSGAGLGINGEDEVSKDLTSNLGIVETINGALKLTVNVRYPVTWKGDHLRSLCIDFLKEAEYDFSLADFTDSESLYFPLEHPLVKAVCDVYAEETGDTKRKPGVMGGGTYARAVKNSVAIGAGFIGDGDAHQVDEKMAISSLYKLSQIYAHLFLQLIEIAK